MPIFKCDKCNCVDNTAVTYYNIRKNGEPALCSECDPKIGKWHGIFSKESAVGLLLGSDGFLYSQEEKDSGNLDWRVKNQDLTFTGIKQ